LRYGNEFGNITRVSSTTKLKSDRCGMEIFDNLN